MKNVGSKFVAVAATLALNMVFSLPARAWGDEGHEVIALIAQSHLDPAALKKLRALLAADPDDLTTHDIAAASTWADKLRTQDDDSARKRTRQWHFVDIELAAPDLARACFGHPPLPAGVLASNGPAHACVVDKINQFAAELASPGTPPEEQIIALKFLLHFVGDLHQPLHASDDHDRGGNDKRVSMPGIRAGNLHHCWDTVFVQQLGPNASRIAADLNRQITEIDIQTWSKGAPADWAMESFAIARQDAYGQLPQPNARGTYQLPEAYISMATHDVASQLSKAGVRLAFMLNKVFGPP